MFLRTTEPYQIAGKDLARSENETENNKENF